MSEHIEITALPLGPLQANCYLLARGRDAVVVDPGDEASLLLRALEGRGLEPCAVLLTHGHFDHCGAAAALAGRFGAPVYVGALDVGSTRGFSSQLCFAIDELAEVVLLKEELSLELPFAITAIPTPGHSRGSYTYALDDTDLFVGDLLFRNSVGRTDFPGGSSTELLASVEGLVRRFPPNAVVHCGHGPATSLGRELAVNPFLSRLRSDPVADR